MISIIIFTAIVIGLKFTPSITKTTFSKARKVVDSVLIVPTFFLSIMLLFVGCNKETYHLNDEFTLDFNKAAIIKMDGTDYQIKFTNLEEESRCPPDVYCFWMGQVAVKINLNNDTDFIIGHHTKIASIAEYKNHTIRLLEVNYDKKKNFGKEKHCSIRLRIE